MMLLFFVCVGDFFLSVHKRKTNNAQSRRKPALPVRRPTPTRREDRKPFWRNDVGRNGWTASSTFDAGERKKGQKRVGSPRSRKKDVGSTGVVGADVQSGGRRRGGLRRQRDAHAPEWSGEKILHFSKEFDRPQVEGLFGDFF